jgi:putative membrane protein
MNFRNNFIPSICSVFFLGSIIVEIVACNEINKISDEDKNKDNAVVLNETRFNDSVKLYDANFLVETAWINIHNIAIGQLGTDKSKSPEILMLAKMLSEEHYVASQELKKIADSKNINLPVSAENDKEESINKLVKQKNISFDKAFIDVVIQQHQQAIEKFETADSTIKDTEIKDYIAIVLPALKIHLQQALQLQKNIR